VTVSGVGAQTSSPLTILQSQLTSQISAGKINSADQSTLSTAISGIVQTVQQEVSSSGGQPPPPEQLQGKIGSLIDQQVSDGKLTSDQASELKSVFSGAAPYVGAAGGGSSTGATSSGSQSDALSSFLESLQGSTGQSVYNAKAKTTLTGSSSLLLNYTS